MVIKDFEERNYMRYKVYDYKYFKKVDLNKEKHQGGDIYQLGID